jgi:zinc D-Ala-D-Ala carboxypeptidase
MSVTLTATDARRMLTALGWPPTVALPTAVRCFQRGWALGPALLDDGIIGPRTSSALDYSGRLHLAGRGTAAEHFSFSEFACGCHGHYAGCGGIWVRRELLIGLEHLRAVAYPTGLRIDSGCRCTFHNQDVGGVHDSQHLWGAAADIPATAPWEAVRRLGEFSGIGRSGAFGLVRHVDVRHDSGHNPTAGTPANPTIWDYTS